MAKKNLHPSVQKFKGFVKDHPELIQEVRKGNTTWQELYEDWYNDHGCSEKYGS